MEESRCAVVVTNARCKVEGMRLAGDVEVKYFSRVAAVITDHPHQRGATWR